MSGPCGCGASRAIGGVEEQRNEAYELLREVAQSGVTVDDERVGYVEVQIDRVTWDAIRTWRD